MIDLICMMNISRYSGYGFYLLVASIFVLFIAFLVYLTKDKIGARKILLISLVLAIIGGSLCTIGAN